MKRLASFLVIIILSVSLLSSALAANTAIVTKPAGAKGSTVRMRQKPDGKVLVNIPFGTEVEVLDNQGEWMQISFDGRTGWMMSEFLSLSNSESDLLSFDITGKWYEWYTVEDLITASERDEPANSRFGVDRFFTEDLLVPSDDKVRNIHQNADGKYIFDNWTDCEVCIIKNDELCILDGYGDDSVHLASLFLVDANTMWYYGSNEYVAVYKRTQPVHSSVRTPERPPQYDNIIGLYATALRDEEFEEHYSDSELNLLAIQDWSSYGGTLQYAVHDVNQDGYDELLIANESDGYFSIIDLYTINETTAVRLFGERSFGYRDNIDILEDGCLYTHGSSGADSVSFAIYSFSSSGFLEELHSGNYSGNDMSIIEERKQTYDNMVVDVKNAYSWIILAQNTPNVFTPADFYEVSASGISQIPYGEFGSVVASVIDKHYGYDSKYAFRNLHGDNQYFVYGDYGINGWAHVTGVTANETITQIMCEQNDWYSHGTSMVEQRIKELLVPVTVFWQNPNIDTKTLVNHIYENLTLYYEGTSYDKQIIETDYSYYENGIEVYVTIVEEKQYKSERITISIFSQIPSETRYYTFSKPKPNR